MQPDLDVERMERKEEYSPCKLFAVLKYSLLKIRKSNDTILPLQEK